MNGWLGTHGQHGFSIFQGELNGRLTVSLISVKSGLLTNVNPFFKGILMLIATSLATNNA